MKKTKAVAILYFFIAAILILQYLVSCKADEENQLFPDRTDDVTLRIAVYEINSNYEIKIVEQLTGFIYDEYGVNAEIITYPYDWGFANDKIATKLLAGDDDFDIYFLRADYIPYYSKVNACYDLSSSKEIVNNFGNMFDGMKDLCSVGDKLCGVPIQVSQANATWECNVELAEQLGIDIAALSTKKMTLPEFYDLAVEAKAKAVELGIEKFYILLDFYVDDKIYHYMTNYLDYTNKTIEDKTQEYVEYVKLYMKMIDEGLIKVDPGWDMNYKNNNVLFKYGGDFSFFSFEKQPFPKPLISVSDLYVIDTNILAINPHSQNIEAAKKYLAYSISLPVLQKRLDYLLKDRDSYEFSWEDYVIKLYNTKMDEETKDALNKMGMEIEEPIPLDEYLIERGMTFEEFVEEYKSSVGSEPTTNGHEVVAFLIKNGKRAYFNVDISNEIRSDVGDLRDRVMTPEDFAQKLYSKCKMIIEE